VTKERVYINTFFFTLPPRLTPTDPTSRQKTKTPLLVFRFSVSRITHRSRQCTYVGCTVVLIVNNTVVRLVGLLLNNSLPVISSDMYIHRNKRSQTNYQLSLELLAFGGIGTWIRTFSPGFAVPNRNIESPIYECYKFSLIISISIIIIIILA